MSRVLHVDLETYSDIDITKAGLYKYVQSPAFEILLAAYAYDNEPTRLIDLTQGEQFPPQLLEDFTRPDITKKAHNATFEWYCLSKYFNIHEPLKWLPQWQDSMIQALYCGFPQSLKNVGDAMGLPEDRKKLATGKALIKYFCKPCLPTSRNGQRTRNYPHHDPEKWHLFGIYCIQDVDTEREIDNRLQSFPVPPSVWAEWRLDAAMQYRGVKMDVDLIEGAKVCSKVINEELMEEARRICPVQNPKSVSQLAAWINEETGASVDDLKKATVTELIGSTDDEVLKRVLQIRQETGKTSIKKYDAMAMAICSDGKLHGVLQFYGANRTGRWAGRIVQVQNLPKNFLKTLELARHMVKAQNVNMIKFIYGNVPDTLSQLIRTAFIPSPGNKFTIADFSAIEARVIAWIAGEQWRQEIFATHGRIYEASAAAMFGVPIETIGHDAEGNDLGNYGLRQKGKVSELALGYGGGPGALITMGALDMGLSEDELPDIVRRWRKASPRICDLWYACNRAAIDTIKTGRTNIVKCVSFSRVLDLRYNLDFMTIQLPSGRKLYYDHPTITKGQRGDRIMYNGLHQKTHKWVQLDTYGGKLVENIVQAVARDCLEVTLERIAAAGYNTVFHIHDEAIIDTPQTGRDDLQNLIDIMAVPIPWAPGLILKGAGFVSDFYKKD